MRNLYILFFFLMINESFGQTPLIPYRSGKLWGLADTLGKVKLIPAYDQIDAESYVHSNTRSISSHYFVVRKGKKFGVLNQSKVIMPVNFYKLSIDSVFIKENNNIEGNPTYGGTRMVLYNLNGQKLFPDTIMDVNPVRLAGKTDHSIFLTMAADHYSLFWYDRKLKSIKQWIVKKAYYIGQSDERGITDIMVQLNKNSPDETVALVYNAVLDQYELKAARGNRPAVQMPGRNNPADATKNNFVLTTRSFFMKDHRIMQVLEEKRYMERNITKKDTVPMDLKSDSATLMTYKFAGRESQHSTIPDYNLRRTDKIDSASIYLNYVTFRKNGKVGLIVEDRMIAADFEEVIYFVPTSGTKPNFMVSKLDENRKLRWGVIDSRGQFVLPCIYDQIIRGEGTGGAWILKKDNLYGLADGYGKLVITPKYQKIIPQGIFTSFTLIDNGKFGYFGFWDNERCEPLFPHAINRTVQFGGYKVFELVDDKENIVGYGDKKGFVYFKN